MSDSFESLSNAFAEAAESAARSIVTVSARRRLPATGIAWSETAIVTANHVVERDENISITLPSGDEVEATVAGRDPGSDIAVLTVPGGLVPATFAPEGAARVGQLVLAAGRPSVAGHQASLGVVSAIGGKWRTFRGQPVNGYIRTDTTMFPGFSGGPLVTAAGAVLGMNSSMLGRGGGLTIPSHALAPIVDALLTGGKVKRAYLGISTQRVALPAAFAAASEQESGLLVSGVEPGSPADSGGVLVGDILIALAGATIEGTEDLQDALSPELVGAWVPVRVLRGGEPVELSITVGERN